MYDRYFDCKENSDYNFDLYLKNNINGDSNFQKHKFNKFFKSSINRKEKIMSSNDKISLIKKSFQSRNYNSNRKSNQPSVKMSNDFIKDEITKSKQNLKHINLTESNAINTSVNDGMNNKNKNYYSYIKQAQVLKPVNLKQNEFKSKLKNNLTTTASCKHSILPSLKNEKFFSVRKGINALFEHSSNFSNSNIEKNTTNISSSIYAKQNSIKTNEFINYFDNGIVNNKVNLYNKIARDQLYEDNRDSVDIINKLQDKDMYLNKNEVLNTNSSVNNTLSQNNNNNNIVDTVSNNNNKDKKNSVNLSSRNCTKSNNVNKENKREPEQNRYENIVYNFLQNKTNKISYRNSQDKNRVYDNFLKRNYNIEDISIDKKFSESNITDISKLREINELDIPESFRQKLIDKLSLKSYLKKQMKENHINSGTNLTHFTNSSKSTVKNVFPNNNRNSQLNNKARNSDFLKIEDFSTNKVVNENYNNTRSSNENQKGSKNEIYLNSLKEYNQIISNRNSKTDIYNTNNTPNNELSNKIVYNRTTKSLISNLSSFNSSSAKLSKKNFLPTKSFKYNHSLMNLKLLLNKKKFKKIFSYINPKAILKEQKLTRKVKARLNQIVFNSNQTCLVAEKKNNDINDKMLNSITNTVNIQQQINKNKKINFGKSQLGLYGNPLFLENIPFKSNNDRLNYKNISENEALTYLKHSLKASQVNNIFNLYKPSIMMPSDNFHSNNEIISRRELVKIIKNNFTAEEFNLLTRDTDKILSKNNNSPLKKLFMPSSLLEKISEEENLIQKKARLIKERERVKVMIQDKKNELKRKYTIITASNEDLNINSRQNTNQSCFNTNAQFNTDNKKVKNASNYKTHNIESSRKGRNKNKDNINQHNSLLHNKASNEHNDNINSNFNIVTSESSEEISIIGNSDYIKRSVSSPKLPKMKIKLSKKQIELLRIDSLERLDNIHSTNRSKVRELTQNLSSTRKKTNPNIKHKNIVNHDHYTSEVLNTKLKLIKEKIKESKIIKQYLIRERKAKIQTENKRKNIVIDRIIRSFFINKGKNDHHVNAKRIIKKDKSKTEENSYIINKNRLSSLILNRINSIQSHISNNSEISNNSNNSIQNKQSEQNIIQKKNKTAKFIIPDKQDKQTLSTISSIDPKYSILVSQRKKISNTNNSKSHYKNNSRSSLHSVFDLSTVDNGNRSLVESVKYRNLQYENKVSNFKQKQEDELVNTMILKKALIGVKSNYAIIKANEDLNN